MKIVALLQARMGSIRLPNKVMRPINNTPMIELMLTRLSQTKRVSQIVLATSVDAKNQPLAEHVHSLGYEVFRGSENDVLDRFYNAALYYKADAVIRITGDCPLIDPTLIDTIIAEYETSGVDYVTNTLPPTYPDGLDVEIFSFHALKLAAQTATQPNEREHVTPFIRTSNIFRHRNVANTVDLSHLRWTVDELVDFAVIEQVFHHFYPRTDFSWHEVLNLQQQSPHIFSANQTIKRNEGSTMSEAEKRNKQTQAGATISHA